ncbi:MAG: hypothetical protein JWM79_3378, partial [Nocardioides sp.]|nr:hypothetical protein [Nocardioides sp.]
MAAPSRRPRTLRLRGAIAVVVAIATSAGFLGLAAPASAAGPWFVAPTPTGANTATCGLAAATPCATVTFVIAKAAFLAGDTINVAPGTYVDRPLFQTKGANVVGTGAGAIFDGSNVSFAIGSLLPAAQSVTLTNLTLRNGNTGTGGGLAIGGGQFTTNNVTLSGNKSPAGGGAYVAANSSLTMNGGAISGNTSTASATAFTGAGAGVYVVGRAGATPAGILRLNNVTVSNNTATGGATAAAGNGGGIF